MSVEQLLRSIGKAVTTSLALLALPALALDGSAANVAQTTQQPAGSAAESRAPGRSLNEATRFPRNAEDFARMFEDIKNWGRWGPEDQLGAMNLVTDAKRKQASRLVKLGRAVGLAHPLLTEPAPDNTSPFEQTMNLAYPGSATDTYKAKYHGTAHSHLDSLCHVFYKDTTYNGYPAAAVVTDKGCTKLGVENLRNGIVTRGILIDIPRLRSVPYLEPGTPVFAEDIEAWEKKAGVRISAGDAVFLRTGRWARRAKLGAWSIHKEGDAGFDASVVPWFKARGVAVAGSDDELDVLPSRVEGLEVPVHSLLIAALGVLVLDNLDLEALADTASQLNRWEFMLILAPLVVNGGTGSPLNPLAIF